MEWVNALRNYLEPEAGDTYGNILPVARDGETSALRLALPMAARDAINNLAYFADAPRAAYAGELDLNDPNTIGRIAVGALEAGGGGMAARALPKDEMARNALRYYRDESGAIKVYHGSPHDFDRFSMDKIGTGEGAQAYGHGLYFAENEDVARGYQSALSGGYDATPLRAAGLSDTDINAAHGFVRNSADADAAFRDFTQWTGKPDTPELRRAFNEAVGSRNDGNLYEVMIDAEPEDFLDWDKPAAEQPESIRKALTSIANKDPEIMRKFKEAHKLGDKGAIYEAILQEKTGNIASNQAAATERMRQAGILGIRYLDQGSRGAGEGSSNYVVFDDELLSILSKNGNALRGY